MKIALVTPAPRGSRLGNRVTAVRYARLLRELGHRVAINPPAPHRHHLLFALHARRSAGIVSAFVDAAPQRPVVVVMTGTDLYCDLPDDGDARRSLELATAIVVLQPEGLTRIPSPWRHKAVVIRQSVVPYGGRATPRKRTFDLCVVGHLREVKDPLRPALAARGLPSASRIAIVQAGRILEPSYRAAVRREMRDNPRYRWIGELPRHRARHLIARSRGLVLPSFAEGGAHVVAEAIVDDTPVLASRIDGTVGQLGADYPGYYPPGDTDALRALMERFERDDAFRARLADAVAAHTPEVMPVKERDSLGGLLDGPLLRP